MLLVERYSDGSQKNSLNLSTVPMASIQRNKPLLLFLAQQLTISPTKHWLKFLLTFQVISSHLSRSLVMAFLSWR